MAKVAISYGHGVNTFPDTGSKGVIKDGVRYAEHTHNAEVGSRVTAILRRHNIDVLELQPPFGKDVPLLTRTNQANTWGADLYYSIHGNAGVSTARGWCGFYWGTSTEGKRIAQIYAAKMVALGLPLYSGDGIHPCQEGDWTNFHELRESNMPALLTENGFMTNAEDFPYIFLNKDGSWDKQAIAHAKTILEYLNIAYREPVIMPTDKITIHNTALWQVRPLVKEYKEKGLKAYCWRVNDLPKDVLPQETDAYKFVIETDFQTANTVKIELSSRGYTVDWTSL
jgi:N-acetylmuramoyl-L-alanine amidase